MMAAIVQTAAIIASVMSPLVAPAE